MKRHLLITLLFLSFPLSASAATVRLVPAPAQIGAGDMVVVSVFVDSTTPVNAFSGELRYNGALSLVSASDGNSIVSLWVDHPREADGAVAFAGLVPGGYAGSGGLLFTATFKATAAGRASVSLQNASFLRNDGSGNTEAVSAEPLVLAVDAVAHGGATTTDDAIPPEPFVIEVASGDLFDGKTYAAFSTTDKGSGVERYEAAERRVPFVPLRWETAQSPYVLHDQYGTSDLYVRAVDAAGNVRVEEYARGEWLRGYEWVVAGLIALLTGTFYYLYAKRT